MATSSDQNTVSDNMLSPIGVFWDIENCSVPRGRSALTLVQRIRDKFFTDHREVEFMCVCDISKENKDVIQQLNYAQVTVVHIIATSKNAADDKLRQCLRRFADAYRPPATVILLSGDVNFASELSDLRHRHKLHVVLIHPHQVGDALVACAHEHYSFEEITSDLPPCTKPYSRTPDGSTKLYVTGLPPFTDTNQIRGRLRQLSDNCGGRVLQITGSTAYIKFPNIDSAQRARKRMDGEDVFGNHVRVDYASSSSSPSPNRLKEKEKQEARIGQSDGENGSSSSHKQKGMSTEKPTHDTPRRRRDRSRRKRTTSEGLVEKESKDLPPSVKRTMSESRAAEKMVISVENSTAENISDAKAVKFDLSKKEKKHDAQKAKKERKKAKRINKIQAIQKAQSDMEIPTRDGEVVSAVNSGIKLSKVKQNDPVKLKGTFSSASKILELVGSEKDGSTPAARLSQLAAMSGMEPEQDQSIAAKFLETNDDEHPGTRDGGLASTESTTPPKGENNNNKEKPCKIISTVKTSSPSKRGSMGPPQSNQPIWSSSHSNQTGRGSAVSNRAGRGSPTVNQSSRNNQASRGSAESSHSSRSSTPALRGPDELRDIIDRLTKDQKPTREVLSLQQQFYQEDQLSGGGRSKDGDGSSSGPHSRPSSSHSTTASHSGPPSRGSDNDFTAAPLPWRNAAAASPKLTLNISLRCPSGGFRRTPGASRPNSRGSSTCSSPRPGEPVGGLFKPIRVPTPQASIAESGSGAWEEEANAGPGLDTPTQLMVSNLDYNISAREWKKILYTEFQQHVQVLGVYIQTQPDNTNISYVRVPTIDEARFAISQFHRKKIGYKRIHVALVSHDNGSNNANTRCEVISLLKEVTGNTIPLFKFIEIFEKRFHRTISVSELYRMKDTVEIEEQGGAGRMVALVPSLRKSPTHSDPSQSDQEVEEILESPICRLHCKEGSSNYMEALDSCTLPNVLMQLKGFASQIHTLLQSHEGSMPLMSLPACYSAEFRDVRVVTEGGVSLEHLVSCVPGVKVAITASGIKKVQWAENKPPANLEFGRTCVSPLMNQQLSQFSREVVDLLKNSNQCRMPFSKFIPSYHHHFGRQCRVADYGYTKLMELFEAIPHIVQIIGGGSRRMVTLSHRAQVKRFTSDLLRVLKYQASKQIAVLDLPIVYNKVIGRPFDITSYGICYIEDMLSELPETTILVTGIGKDMIISIPRREQTADEMERSKQFAVEVIDLLRHSPQCRMPFNKFIPAYHHHFGKQCRVADYGFTKLIELFEAIPHVLQVADEDDEKILCLTEQELLNVLEEQVAALLKSLPTLQLPVPEFLTLFMRFHGHSIRLHDYGVSSVTELIDKIPNTAKIESQEGRLVIVLVDHSHEQQLAQRILLILMDKPEGSMGVSELCSIFEATYSEQLVIAEVCTDLTHYVQVTSPDKGGIVKLCALQLFARDVRTLLQANQGRLSLSQFETAYARYFGVSLVTASYGYHSVTALLQAIPHMVTLRGKGYRRTVLLNQEFHGQANCLGWDERSPTPSDSSRGQSPQNMLSSTQSNDSGITDSHEDDDRELMMLAGPGLGVKSGIVARCQSPWDFVRDPIPPNVPSPELQPGRQSIQLMRFDTSPPVSQDMFCGMTPDEKARQRTPLCKTPESEMLHFAAQLLPPDRSGPTLPPVNHQYVSASIPAVSPPPFSTTQMVPSDSPVGQYVFRGTTYFMAGQEVQGGLYGAEVGAPLGHGWYPIPASDGSGQTSPIPLPTVVHTVHPLSTNTNSMDPAVLPENPLTQGEDGSNNEDTEESGLRQVSSPSLQEAGAQLKQLLQDTTIRSPTGSPMLIKEKVVTSSGGNTVPSRRSPNLGIQQVCSYASSGNTSPSASPVIDITISTKAGSTKRASAPTPPIVEDQADIEKLIAETENMATLNPISYPTDSAQQMSADASRCCRHVEESVELDTISPPKPVSVSPRWQPRPEREPSSPQRAMSESSLSPMGSPLKGTPRRSRLAARFQIPASPASSDTMSSCD